MFFLLPFYSVFSESFPSVDVIVPAPLSTKDLVKSINKAGIKGVQRDPFGPWRSPHVEVFFVLTLIYNFFNFQAATLRPCKSLRRESVMRKWNAQRFVFFIKIKVSSHDEHLMHTRPWQTVTVQKISNFPSLQKCICLPQTHCANWFCQAIKIWRPKW